MKYRAFGSTGMTVSEIGYGAWGLGAGIQWKGGNDDAALAALRRSFELGVNFVDTALAYNEGHSERLVSQVVKEFGQQIYVATKVPPKDRIWPARPGVPITTVFPYEYVISSTETSLRNLRADRIDLQQLHVWNPEWIDQDEWRRAFEDLKSSGKVRALGISINDHQPDSALELIKTGLIDAAQVIYNIFDQSPAKSLFPLCEERQIGVIARVPLDEGALTGAITEQSQFDDNEFRAMYFRGDRKKQVVEHVERLQGDLKGVDGSLSDIALQFCLSNPAVSTVIPGMRKIQNVVRNVGVSERGPLSAPVLSILAKHAWDRNFYN